MKKTASLILAMLLLLSGCGKSSKLINPPAPPAAPAGTQAPKEPEIKTPSESEKKSDETKEITAQSEMKSEETTEKQEEEKAEEPTVESSKLSRFGWWAAKKTAKVAAIAATAYGLYKLTRYVIGEEEWNRIMNPEPKPIETQENANQPPSGGEGNVDEDSLSSLSSSSDPQQPNSSPIYRYLETKPDVNDYSDTSIQETVDKGDGVAFDIFNHAQKYGYPENNLEAKRFKDIQPSNSGTWHWASRSGKLVKLEKDTDYGAKVGLTDCSSDSSDWESS